MGFMFSRWLCLTCASTDCLYFAKLQRKPSRSTSQMAWKRDSPQGEPHLARPVGGLLRGRPGESSPRLSSQLQRKMVHVTLIVWGRIREARSVSRLRSFSKNSNGRQGKYLEPNTPKLKILMLHSLKKTNPCLTLGPACWSPGSHHSSRFLLLRQLLPSERKTVQIR